MEIKHYHIDETDVYLTPLLTADKRREAERQTEERLLYELLGQKARLNHDDNGKPQIDEYNISISHSRHYLCIAISQSKQIGIDIEEISPRLDRVKQRFLTKEELMGFDNNDLRKLALCWSAKEAMYKLVGERAGAMGENIHVFTDEIGDKQIKTEFEKKIYELHIVEQTEEYEIVLACE